MDFIAVYPTDCYCHRIDCDATMKAESFMQEGRSNRAGCSICNNPIPQELERFEMSYTNRFNHNTYIRLCPVCLLKLANMVDKKSKAFKDYEARLVIEAI